MASSLQAPPQKRRKPLLLHAPTAEDEIPEANKMMYKSKSDLEEGTNDPPVLEDHAGEQEEDDDEFARMVSRQR